MKALFYTLLLSLATVYAQSDPLKQLSDLAAAGNGLITLDAQLFDVLTSPKRTWSASIQFTALAKNRNCMPCKCVPLSSLSVLSNGVAESSILPSPRSQKLGPMLLLIRENSTSLQP